MWIEHQKALVIGLGASGQAAARLLRRRGASQVLIVDQAVNPDLNRLADRLRSEGVEVELGLQALPPLAFDLAVISPGVPSQGLLAREVRRRGIPLLGELELGFREYPSKPVVAITGTNGKTTTTELVEKMLNHAGKTTRAAGNIGFPLCQLAMDRPDLEWLTLEVSSFQLETIVKFHPRIALLLNVTPDHLDRYPDMEDYLQTKARLFVNQTSDDWAILQIETLEMLRRMSLKPRSRIVTFSACREEADLFAREGIIWRRNGSDTEALLRLDQVRLQGPHNAENLMATLAVGMAAELPVKTITEALSAYEPAPHRCERVAKFRDVLFVNDSKATNIDAVAKALMTMPHDPGNERNIWLIAGGRDKGFSFEGLESLLARRVKGAVLIGETGERIAAAWRGFTPCLLADTLVKAVHVAAKQAVSGDVVLLSPACSSFDMFKNYQHRGETFRSAVRQWIASESVAVSANLPLHEHGPGPGASLMSLAAQSKTMTTWAASTM
ncbi:MAG TPA: UDP-N-acetylmuramoyl-L-alanine--D-glutamate ligase [Candidatus Paceibacterota bacterium]|nr:UDP-N-acetylmuramoyl-L-alanine--D-glutamate ligase [Verrucomicrobiota bacterium]HRY48462.1 UDP-N-acetylmuramoyl-L-alanine--D-glutamate ligase [Candidatus Paceibacterota bacterium]HRZ99650.1 UDP-N-acetylmuramoyl-L-alanine--D-glutamate ligase [Candidatus Paceibacterota bacterium]